MNQYKKSQDLEIYELEYKDNANLQETCDVRQPVIFRFDHVIQNTAPIDLAILSSVEKEGGNTLNVKDIFEYYTETGEGAPIPHSSVTEVPLSFHSTLRLIKTDSNIHFFTENNHSFIEETGLDVLMTKIGNVHLKPTTTIQQTFDIMTGTKGVGLPLRFHTNTRKYIYVSGGRISVKMTPFKNARKLGISRGGDGSPIRCWNPQKEASHVISKIRFLEFDVLKGNVLYIPPYWVYSIQYSLDDTCLLEYNYKTAMNVIAHPGEMIEATRDALGSVFMKKGKGGRDGDEGVLGSGDTDIPPIQSSTTEYDLSAISA
jgi:hypothetical protein